ncbi:RHS repeat-associated core domain-containing protein [Chishuiella changwenlii]|uniref:RHS repeat-associated core domain-containing protein n=1 Tax=Chishuiella changwenlii TaxID=1434701 RepID=UPI001E2F582C|nr:RHS repeat-associated core domain-containing protein [Chishuiella changwenlii]
MLEENNYYPFGLKHSGYDGGKLGNQNYHYKYNGKELQTDLNINLYDYGARNYDPAIGRWFNIDPLAEQYRKWSPYTYAVNNPIRFTDPDGMSVNDFVQRKNGSIYWDRNADSQETTKLGETYLGRNLSFTFNSYIDEDSWDGPLGNFPVGDKVTSTINVSANTDKDNNLLSINVNSDEPRIHKTGGWIPTDNYYPGETNYKVNISELKNGQQVSYEQHAKVNVLEEVGLNLMGYDKVNVAQKLTIGLNGNNLSLAASTDIFPSASLSVKGSGNSNSFRLMNYKQPSFKNTHRTNTVIREGNIGAMPVRRVTSRNQSAIFYERYRN